MKNKLWILALVGISLTGCYTSFVPRDYEEESYGTLQDAYYESDEYDTNYDTLDYVDDEYIYEDPRDITIINNYPPEWGWDFYSPVYVSSRYNYWGISYDPFFDPYYGPYYSPYYRPYYSSYVYWDYYYGPYYNNSSYYPSDVRYRNQSHWTSLRNTGGRTSVVRSRDNVNSSSNRVWKRDFDSREVKGFDLDRELRATRSSGSSGASVTTTRNEGTRTASIIKNDEVKTVQRKTSDLERRRISTKAIDKDLIKSKNESRTVNNQKVKKETTTKRNYSSSSKSSSQNRTKRVYSSTSSSKSNTATRSYYKPSSRSNNSRSSSVSQSSRNSGTSQRYS